MRQSAITLVAQVKEAELGSLRRVLRTREAELLQAIGRIGTVHYARWVIVLGPGDGFKPLLTFGSDFDGPVDAHLNDLVTHLGPLLDDIYAHCEGYQPAADKVAYLTGIRKKEAAVYQGAPGRTVQTIAQEKALRARLAQLAGAGTWAGMSASAIHVALRRQVLAEKEFTWAKDRLPTPRVNYLALALLALPALLFAVFFLLPWAVYMQFAHEVWDEPGRTTPNQVSDGLIDENVREEDFHYQNQFSQVMLMKPGRARLVTVNLMFFLTRLLVRLLFVKGKLMGIPTIHFARWVQLDRDRLLFFSNFDGSWTQYLGDFIDKSGWGLNAIFGNTRPFPRIWFLFFRGAYDEMHFLGWSRSTQVPTQVWYASERDQSIQNINANTRVRNALNRDLGERDAQRFLSGL
jgi:hypothetical protein